MLIEGGRLSVAAPLLPLLLLLHLHLLLLCLLITLLPLLLLLLQLFIRQRLIGFVRQHLLQLQLHNVLPNQPCVAIEQLQVACTSTSPPNPVPLSSEAMKNA